MGQDYQPEGYPQQGSEPADYLPNGFGENSFGQNGFGQDSGGTQAYGTQPGYGQNGFIPGSPSAPEAPNGQATYTADGYEPGGFGAPGTRQDGYPQDQYAQDQYAQDQYAAQDQYPQDQYAAQDQYAQDQYALRTSIPRTVPQDPYIQDPYGQGGYGQQGSEQPAGAGYDDDQAAGRGRRSRSGPPRSGPRSSQPLAGARMGLYLAAAVVGVVVIVLLVIHLTKSGANNAATGSSTPSTGATTATGANGTNSYVVTQAASVGSYPLNKAATTQYTAAALHQSAPIVAKIKTQGAGQPGKDVVGIYNLTSVPSIASAGYKGMVVVAYDGTFNPAAVIKLEQAKLESSRAVPAGPHGGKMLCGYNTSSGSAASECVWVTKTTFGEIEYTAGAVPVKYPGAATLALQVRNSVEVRSS